MRSSATRRTHSNSKFFYLSRLVKKQRFSIITMKVFIVICALFVVAVQANPQFRALRARASGLGGGTAPQAAPQPAAAPQPLYQQQPQYQALSSSNFGRPLQYQPQPQYQAQPQYGRFPQA
ncbi:hypothetical protein CDAR_496991 [Caerostris darwini]|uniref:Uncharacterized protein n=1 Tax=Caerostris darwini TaxID=1538125 RepID=A0AAV4S3I3_9ARAC|nr:hypothetical protein CDAR_496991 [Caerostris darwini]